MSKMDLVYMAGIVLLVFAILDTWQQSRETNAFIEKIVERAKK